MQELFHIAFYQPLFNLLIAIYNILPNHDLGLAIIILTAIVKVALFPLSWKQLKAQQVMQDIQPKMEALKVQYKDDADGLRVAQMKFLQEEKINPFAPCLPLFIQIPFFIAIYYVFISGLSTTNFSELYPFVQNPGALNTSFLGWFSLTDVAIKQNPWVINAGALILPILAGLTQFWQAKMMYVQRPPRVPGAQDEDFAAVLNQQMLYFAPGMTVLFGVMFPVGLSLYWLVNTILSIGQQHFFLRGHKKTKENEGRGAGSVVVTQ